MSSLDSMTVSLVTPWGALLGQGYLELNGFNVQSSSTSVKF